MQNCELFWFFKFLMFYFGFRRMQVELLDLSYDFICVAFRKNFLPWSNYRKTCTERDNFN
jgi:hypothetical protein